MDVRKKKTEEMKMKKRYLALALAAVLAVCAAGCGKEEAKDDSNKTAEKGTVDTTEILQAQMPGGGRGNRRDYYIQRGCEDALFPRRST